MQQPIDNGLGFSNTLRLEEEAGDHDCFDPQDIDSAPGKSAKKSSQESQIPPNPSIELLKQIGLPILLCDLVYNMLDCMNGDLAGDKPFLGCLMLR